MAPVLAPVLAMVLALTLGLPGASRAQTPALADRIGTTAAREAARTAAETARPGTIIAVEPRPEVGTEAFCLPISAIRVEGVTLLPAGVVDATVTRYAASCMGAARIDTLLQVLTDLYLERGYITSRAYIPQQDLSDGTLDLVVVEGRIEAIAYGRSLNGRPDDNASPRRVRAALPLDAGDPLDLRRIEQGVDQLNAPGSAQVAVDIRPGQEIGGSVLVFAVEDADTVRGAVSLRDQRQEGGRDATLGVSVTADNVVQLNETWSLGYTGGVNSNALSLGVTVPFRMWTHSFSASLSDQISPLTATSELYERTRTLRYSARRLLFRDATVKRHLGLTLSDHLVQRAVNGTALGDQRHRALGVEHSTEITGAGRYTAYSLGVTAGKRQEGAGFSLASLSAQQFRALSDRATLYATFEAQLAARPLPSAHAFQIGGSGLVRGFEGGSVSGDSGLALSAEVALRPHAETEAARLGLTSYAFADLGMARATHRTPSTMAALGIGLRATVAGVTLDGSLAVPVHATGGARRAGPGFRLTLGRKLF